MDQASHKDRLPALRQIEARLKGIADMIGAERHCVEIVKELKGVRSDLKGFQSAVLQTHIDHCLARAADSADLAEKRRITKEVMELLESTSG